jgi:hypothetical protein
MYRWSCGRRGAPARAGPERWAEAQALASRDDEPEARVPTASRARRVVTLSQATSELEGCGPPARVLPSAHGVSIPELKKLTNLKMHLKPSVQDVWQPENLDSGSTL